MKNNLTGFITVFLFTLLSFLLSHSPAYAVLRARHKAVVDSPDNGKPPVLNQLKHLLGKEKEAVTKFTTTKHADSAAVDSPGAKEQGKLKRFYDKKADQVYRYKHPDHKLRSGIFGKLAFYCGLLTLLALGLAFIVTSHTLGGVIAVLYSIGFFGGLVFGGIGITRRRKRGKAILGLGIILLQILLFAGIASFASGVAAAAPALFDVMVVIMLMGRG
jgi:hypothetical protein